MQKIGKLELTWVGKYENKIIEPRILVEDKSKSYGDPNSKNMLIHGDNLIALQALMQDYAGQIKCIYIDPPFNTGNAFDYYDDGLEHSIWLDLMYRRLKILHELLRSDGVILIELDDNEMPYLRVILDEIFGRNHFVAQINVKSNSISGNKTAHKDKTILRNKDNIIVYKRGEDLEIEPQYTERTRWDTHYNSYAVYDESGKITRLEKLKDKLIEANIIRRNEAIRENILLRPDFYEYILKNKNSICRLVNSIPTKMKEMSLQHPDEIVEYTDEKGVQRFALNGSRISLLSSAIYSINGEEKFIQLLGDLWTDIDFQNTQNEGQVSFPASKKPEALIRRLLNMFTKEGDLVLDSFLGSGTTAAVAHKMHRNWIGVELGEHAYSHCKVRLDAVVDGRDNSGISEAVNWKGGGGYHFYELAPSLLVHNEKLKNVYQINPEYTFEMLCEAICKIEGFKYKCDGVFHGTSSEDRFIHITKDYVNAEYIKSISATLREGQSLLVYGIKIQSDLVLPDNIEVKKIPKDLLKKCDFESEVR